MSTEAAQSRVVAQPAATVLAQTPDSTLNTATPAQSASQEVLVERDLLVEDVSIDGMCGVY